MPYFDCSLDTLAAYANQYRKTRDPQLMEQILYSVDGLILYYISQCTKRCRGVFKVYPMKEFYNAAVVGVMKAFSPDCKYRKDIQPHNIPCRIRAYVRREIQPMVDEFYFAVRVDSTDDTAQSVNVTNWTRQIASSFLHKKTCAAVDIEWMTDSKNCPKMTPLMRLVLKCRYIEEMTFSQIAKLTGMKSTSMIFAHDNALHHIRQMLIEKGEGNLKMKCQVAVREAKNEKYRETRRGLNRIKREKQRQSKMVDSSHD